MPYKFNESRRYKIKKSLTNWRDYNVALRWRSDIGVWFTPEAIAQWRPAKTGHRSRPRECSHHAIETAAFLRQVFRGQFALRLGEEFMSLIT
jgi:hypothetical protein